MRILFITPSYKPAYIYGGPTMSVSELAESLASDGYRVEVLTTTANGKEELPLRANQAVDVNGVRVTYFKRITGDHTHVSPALWLHLWKSLHNYDVIHIQSWWSVLVFGAAAICAMRSKRFVLSPRGMLSTYSFTHHHGAAKNWVHKLFGNRLLKFSYLHATSQMEWEECRLIDSKWEGFVLPNLVKLPEKRNMEGSRHESTLVLGFLSRIDKKKGLENLFQALSEATFDYRLKIAGSGEHSYVDTLKQLSLELNISDKIEWCGWKKDHEKFEFLASTDLFVLTSYNENFANVVIESLSVGTPVLVSDAVGLSDYVLQKGLGWTCKPESTSILTALTRIANLFKAGLPIDSRLLSGTVYEDFNASHLAGQYATSYSLLGQEAVMNKGYGRKGE